MAEEVETKTLDQTMCEAGYIPANEAARAAGLTFVGSMHRQAKRGFLGAKQVNGHWFISAASLVRAYAGTPMEQQVKRVLRSLGCAPKPGTDVIPPQRKKPGRKPGKKKR